MFKTVDVPVLWDGDLVIDTARVAVLILSAAILSGGAALTVGVFAVPEANGDGTDYGLDTDGNGLYDWLVVLAPVNVPEAGIWDIAGIVLTTTMPSGGSCGNVYGTRPVGVFEIPPETVYPIAYVYERYFFEAGAQSIRLAFPGTDLFRAGIDGPYRVDASLSLTGGIVYDMIGIWPGPIPPTVTWTGTTQAYRASDFEEPVRPVAFTGGYSDSPVHVDDDGLYDLLELRADVKVSVPGTYSLNGVLMERPPATGEYGYRSIAYAYRDVRLDSHDTSVLLRFRGDQIRMAGIDGPWDFSLTLYGSGPIIYGDGNVTPGLSTGPVAAYPESLCGTTLGYRAADFDDTMEILRYTGVFEESTVDYDGDLLADLLVVRAEVDVLQSAGFDFQGTLSSEDGSQSIGSFFAQAWLAEGLGWTEWTFPGPDIRASGLDGPYIARLSITPSAGGIDPVTTYRTKAYLHTEFEEAGSNRSAYWIAGVRAGALNGTTLRIEVDVQRGNDLLTYVIYDTLTVAVIDSAGAVVYRVVERVELPSGGSIQSFAYLVGLGRGTYTVLAILGPEDHPVDTQRLLVTL
ncbi:MAG TPA: hypothetical protein VJ300_05760 [Thermoplasmata archaeon]|nr:hypothetical protein [Thermoplasmata archaeon]